MNNTAKEFFAVRVGYAPTVIGPLSEADARAECERIAQNGDTARLMQCVAECNPQRRPVTWREETRS